MPVLVFFVTCFVTESLIALFTVERKLPRVHLHVALQTVLALIFLAAFSASKLSDDVRLTFLSRLPLDHPRNTLRNSVHLRINHQISTSSWVCKGE